MKKNYFKNLMQVSLLLGAAFVISSCDDIIGQEDNPVASYVQWDANTPKSIELTLGIPGKSTATVKAVAVSSVVIVYESENTEIAKIDPVTGVVTAVGVGETNIKAVVTGASSAGQSVFIPEEIKIPVVVKDGKAKLTRVKDEVIEFTANKDSIIDLQKLFTAYPKVGTGNDNSKIEFSAFTYDLTGTPKTWTKVNFVNDLSNLGALDNTNKEFKIGAQLDASKLDVTKHISDTIYVVAELQAATGTPTYVFPAGTATEAEKDIVKDTVKIVINKSIAYLNEKNERTILTADKYTTFTDAINATEWDGTLKAGTYLADAWLGTWTPKISGDVSIIIPNNNIWNYNALDDAKDGSTLNFFRQANVKDGMGDDLPVGIMRFRGATNVITNFKAINLYGGTIEFSNTIAGVGEINVYNDAKLTTYQSDYASYYTGKIQLKDGGKLTVAGGTVDIIGWGTDLNTGFAVIGDVEVSKGVFTASNSDYRAVKGNLTAGGKTLIKESNDNSTWTAIEGTTSTAKYIKAQDKSDTWK
jgi:hypothetical protein